MLSSRSVAVMERWLPFGLAEKIGENGDGGLALDHALREFEFAKQVELLDAEFHR